MLIKKISQSDLITSILIKKYIFLNYLLLEFGIENKKESLNEGCFRDIILNKVKLIKYKKNKHLMLFKKIN